MQEMSPQILLQSPSVWREWIEIGIVKKWDYLDESPSVWREWIEIPRILVRKLSIKVSLRVEGVD